MKRFITATIVLITLLLPLSAQVSVKLDMNNTFFEVYHKSHYTEFISIKDFDENKEEVSVSVMYELPSENELHFLLGGGLGYFIKGAMDATGAFGIDYQLFETRKYSWSLQSTAKIGLIVMPEYSGYEQFSVDLVESSKARKGFFWGIGLLSNILYIPYENDAGDKDPRVFWDQGIRMSFGYKF